jgi:hypothetical protein
MGGREFAVKHLRFPQQTERRIKHRFGHAFAVEDLHSFSQVHCTRRTSRQVSVLRIPRAKTVENSVLALRVLLETVAAPGVNAFDLLAHLAQLFHSAQRCEQGGAGKLSVLAVNFKELEAIVTDTNPHRTCAISRLEIFLPEIRWLENMAVGVDQKFF